MAKQAISPSDLEGKFRELQGEVETTTTSAKEYVIVAGAIALVAVASVAFVMGRRRGKRKSTVVEVRRL